MRHLQKREWRVLFAVFLTQTVWMSQGTRQYYPPFLGIRTSGYETLGKLKERPLLGSVAQTSLLKMSRLQPLPLSSLNKALSPVKVKLRDINSLNNLRPDFNGILMRSLIKKITQFDVPPPFEEQFAQCLDNPYYSL